MAFKLSEDELHDVLKSLNVQVSPKEVRNPTRDFMIRVFECVLKDLQIDVNSADLKPWVAVQHIMMPEIFEISICIILLTMSVNAVLQYCNLNITIKDIVEPKPKRTKKILNFLVTLWNHYLKKYRRYQIVDEILQEEQNKAENVAADNNNIDEKIHDVINDLKNFSDNDQVESKVAEKEDKLNNLINEGDSSKEEYQLMKESEIKIQKDLGDMDVKIIDAREKLKRLSEAILKSPARLDEEIQSLKGKIKEEDDKIKNIDDSIRGKHGNISFIENQQIETEKLVTFHNEIDPYIDIFCEKASEVCGKSKLEEIELELKSLQDNISEKQEQMLIEETVIAKNYLENMKHKEALPEMLKAQEMQLADRKQKCEMARENLKQLQHKLYEVTALKLTEEKEFENFCADCDKQIDHFDKSMDDKQNEFKEDTQNSITYLNEYFNM